MAENETPVGEATQTDEQQIDEQQSVDTTPSEGQTPSGDTQVQTAEQKAAAERDTAAAAAKAAAEKAPTVGDAIEEAIASAGPKKIAPKQSDEEIAAQAAADEKKDGRPRNADGTFKAETPDEKAAREAAAAETDEEKAAKEAAKKTDAVDAPIPDEVKGRTRERMQELIGVVKEQRVLAEQHNALFSAIEGTGATPDEFATMVSYMRAAHSNDPTLLQAAYKSLQSELRHLAIRLNTPIPEVNLLVDRDNADLVKELQEGKITAQRAHEVALGRARAKFEGERSTQVRTREQAAAADKQAVAAGRQSLNTLEGELIAADGQEIYARKSAIVVKQLDELFTRLDPKEWSRVFKATYAALPDPGAPAAPRTVVPQGAKPPGAPVRKQPLRPHAPANAGNVTSGPKSALEAINQALEA